MRPPRKSWALTTKSISSLFEALEVCLSEKFDFSARYNALRKARLAVAELEEFVNDSEECEEP